VSDGSIDDGEDGGVEIHIHLTYPMRAHVRCPECDILCGVHDRIRDMGGGTPMPNMNSTSSASSMHRYQRLSL
jgi:hypothetical protein